jgi:hypothetical protein
VLTFDEARRIAVNVATLPGLLGGGYQMSSENSRNAARGMFLTAAELCKHGFNVTPTSRNMAGADLLITDDACRTTWTIQVKVTDQTFKRRRGWLIGRHAELTANKTHAYVFVLLKGDERPDFYIVPSQFVATHQSGATSMPEFRLTDAAPYLERWTVLKDRRSRLLK